MLLVLLRLGLLLRVVFLFLYLSTVFLRSDWVCLAGNDCKSLWELADFVTSQVFTVLTCIMALFSVLAYCKRYSSLVLFIAFAFSIVPWAIIIPHIEQENGMQASWAFSVAVIGSVVALVSLVLMPWSSASSEAMIFSTLLMVPSIDKRVVLYFSLFAFACSCGALVSFVDIVTTGIPQFQAACAINLTFALCQLVAVTLLYTFIVRGGDRRYQIYCVNLVQFIAIACGWTSFGLFVQRNVLPMPIINANEFYVAGLVLGASLASTLVCLLLCLEIAPRAPTKLTVFPEIYSLWAFALATGGGFASLAVFLDSEDDGHNVLVISAVKGCFLLNVLGLLLLEAFWIHSQDFLKRLLVCCIVANAIGFAVLVNAHHGALTFSSSGALASIVGQCAILCLQMAFPPHHPMPTLPHLRLVRYRQQQLEDDTEVAEVRKQLLEEQLKLEQIKRRMLQRT